MKVPLAMFVKEGQSRSSHVVTYVYHIDVEQVLSEPHWHTASFPLMTEFQVEKINEWNSPSGVRCVQIEVRNAAFWVKLRFDPAKNLDSRFGEVVAIGSLAEFMESEYFRKEVFNPIASTVFVGPLAGLSYKMKLALLEFVDFQNGGVTAGTYTDQGRWFVSVKIASHNVFNSLRMDQAARVAQVINGDMLTLIKTFASVAEVAGIEGINLVTVIQYKSFLEESASPARDNLALWVPLPTAVRFKNNETTSQQMMNASVILLNDNRIEAVLSSGAR